MVQHHLNAFREGYTFCMSIELAHIFFIEQGNRSTRWIFEGRVHYFAMDVNFTYGFACVEVFHFTCEAVPVDAVE
jgi:hypothetical protein